MAAAAKSVKVPLPFRLIQSVIIVGGGTYLSSLLFPKDVENVLFDIADHLVLPVMHRMDAEDAHKLSIFVAKHLPVLCPRETGGDDEVLASTVLNLPFPNPVGLAAGFDKNGEIVGPLLNMGFGFVEVGSVTPQPQPGNPRPRVFRLDEDEAVINRCGFNSEGAKSVLRNLRFFENRRCDYNPGLLGVNVGKNKTTEDSMTAQDYAEAIQRLGPSANYVVVNVSSPNTPGLRSLANDKEAIRQIIARSCEARDQAVERRGKRQQDLQALLHPQIAHKTKAQGTHTKSNLPVDLPLFVKISPDLSEEELNMLLDVIVSFQRSNAGNTSTVDGVIVSNTTTKRPDTLRAPPTLIAQAGGLSGRPLKDLSTQLVARVYMKTQGKMPIIGVGGVSCGKDAFEKIAAGASLVQVYSMLALRGPGSVRKVKRELAATLREKGFKCVQDAVGTEAEAWSRPR